PRIDTRVMMERNVRLGFRERRARKRLKRRAGILRFSKLAAQDKEQESLKMRPRHGAPGPGQESVILAAFIFSRFREFRTRPSAWMAYTPEMPICGDDDDPPHKDAECKRKRLQRARTGKRNRCCAVSSETPR